MPTERYTRGEEIVGYLRLLGRHFELYERALFQTRITSLTWDGQRSRWHARTDRGDRIDARFVTTQSGIFDRPQLPGIPGITTFKGSIFHSARWNYDYTGGDSDGNLTGLHGKRVGIIGTGATAVQCIPHLAEAAEHLYVFQRTPSSIDVPRQPAHRPRMGAAPGARLAAPPHGQLQHLGVGRLSGGRPGERRVDRHHRQVADHGAQRQLRRHESRAPGGHDGAGATSRRWSRSGRGSTAS